MSGDNSNGGTSTLMHARPSAAGLKTDALRGLLPFPRELRDKIYADLLRGPWLVFGPPALKNDHAALASNRNSTELALLRVWKATSAEASQILYKEGNFLIRLSLTIMGYDPLFDAPMFDAVPQMNNITFQVCTEELEGRPIPTDYNIKNFERSIGILTGAGTLRNSMHLTFAKQAMLIIYFISRSGRESFDALRGLTGFRELLIDLTSDDGSFCDDRDANLLKNWLGPWLEPWLGRAASNSNLTPLPHLVFHPSQYAAETMKANAQMLLEEADSLTRQEG